MFQLGDNPDSNIVLLDLETGQDRVDDIIGRAYVVAKDLISSLP